MSTPLANDPPGKLGNPDMKFFQDPRAHPKVVAALKSMGADGSTPMPFEKLSLDDVSSPEFMAQSEAGVAAFYDNVPVDLPEDEHEPATTRTTDEFIASDGVRRTLFIFRPANIPTGDPIPAVVYIHGGGMTLGQTGNRLHMRWCKSMAARNVLAIAVDFRNAWTAEGLNPFPVGLNDCVAAVKSLISRKKELGIGKLILQGESGGANLIHALSMRAKREGWLGGIDGIFSMIPFISGGYGWPVERQRAELPSLVENDGYFLHNLTSAGLAKFYAPDDAENPLAWPYFASVEDCRGLPPHRLSLDELDPCRDEGVAYYRKLLAAGVTATAHVNLGMTHASGLIFRQLIPEAYNRTIGDIVDFARTV